MTHILMQAGAVQRAAQRRNEALTDALLVWPEGDWRVQQVKKDFEELSAAYETLKNLAAANV